MNHEYVRTACFNTDGSAPRNIVTDNTILKYKVAVLYAFAAKFDII